MRFSPLWLEMQKHQWDQCDSLFPAWRSDVQGPQENSFQRRVVQLLLDLVLIYRQTQQCYGSVQSIFFIVIFRLGYRHSEIQVSKPWQNNIAVFLVEMFQRWLWGNMMAHWAGLLTLRVEDSARNSYQNVLEDDTESPPTSGLQWPIADSDL